MSSITITHTLSTSQLQEIDALAEKRGFSRERAFRALYEVRKIHVPEAAQETTEASPAPPVKPRKG